MADESTMSPQALNAMKAQAASAGKPSPTPATTGGGKTAAVKAAIEEKMEQGWDVKKIFKWLPESVKGVALLQLAQMAQQGIIRGGEKAVETAGKFDIGSRGLTFPFDTPHPSHSQEMAGMADAMGMGMFAQQMTQRRKDLIDRQNMQMLMTQKPELAQQILAGRELPQDAVVIGGRQRTDLLREVAGRMSSGQFQQQDQGGMMGMGGGQ